MGREAKCHCKWGDQAGDCKVLLEGSELILRSPIRRKVPISSLLDVTVAGPRLLFRAGDDQVELHLGSEIAPRWAKAIATPPPTLAKKLGITAATRLRVIGSVHGDDLKAAVAVAGSRHRSPSDECNLVLICVSSQTDLLAALDQYFAGKNQSASLWIVHPKGAQTDINESDMRSLLGSRGYTDTKVAAVDAKLTAIRFVLRKEKT